MVPVREKLMSKESAVVRSEIVRHPNTGLIYEVISVGYRSASNPAWFNLMRSESRWLLDGREIAEVTATALIGTDEIEYMKYFKQDKANTITLR